MNTPIERLHTALETLGLKAVEARLENLLEQASKKEPSYADFLEELLSCEIEARRTRYLRARLQLAHLPFVKTFEQFDFGFQPSIDERQIRELRSLRFIHEASNVIFLGPPGVGKTHLSVALAEAAIRSGLGAYFITAHDLAADLGRAYREGRLDRRMRVYLAPKVLVIDEVGYLPLDDLGTTIFFQLVSARYERGSIILTSISISGVWRRSTPFNQTRSNENNTARPRRYKSSLNWLTPLESRQTISPSRMALCALNPSKALRRTSKLLYWLRRRETRRQWPSST
jgi:DNA replication protein DnaC